MKINLSTNDLRNLVNPETDFGQNLLYIEGQTLVDVRIVDSSLEIETNLGVYHLLAEGGCCSKSWFEAVEAIDIAKGHLITQVVFRDTKNFVTENEVEDDHIKIYAAEIHTLGGICWFEMRNSSNGYYGGNWGVSFTIHPHLRDISQILLS